jgi:gliding motility-associated-like protein
MKKLLLALMLFFGCMIISNAQPANDNCITAQNLGNLPAPAACPSGVGANLPVAGTIVAATEANPYVFQNGCSGAGGPNMGVPANDVWYSFVATGFQAVITVNSTFANPNIAMYSGTCGALGGGVGGCAVGTGGTVTLTVEQLFPGTTYYVQISGNTGQSGTFNMNIRNNRDCADCLISSNLVVNPPPVNGSYQPGQVVNFCYTVNDYSQINTNWFHGVQITFGAGWAGISGQVPAAAIGGAGTWGWYPSCTQSIPPFQAFGQGFYIDLDGDGNPGNNFGDNCDLLGTGIPCPGPASWTFCWNMTVAAGCAPGSNLSVTVNTSGDGESGSWNNPGCIDDPASIAPATGACCPPNMAAVNISCPGQSDGQATATPIGATGPYEYSWAGPGGYVNSASGIPGANTISGLSTSGVYTVSVTDNNNCLTTATVTVNIGTVPAPAAANTGPYCEGATINLSVGAGFVDWDWLGPGVYNQANTQNPTLALATPAMAGVYTVTVTNAGGCTATATTTVTVNTLPLPNAGNSGPYCPGATIDLTSNGGVDYDWVGPNFYVQNNIQNPSIPGATLAMAGVYTVTVTNAGNCSATATTTVVIAAGAAAVANNTGPYCVGATIDLSSPNGAIDYDWVGPNAYAQNNTQNPSIPGSTPVMAGVYTVTVTFAGGCTSTGTTTVVVNPVPVPGANSNSPICAGTALNLGSNGGVDYDWIGPNAFVQNNTQNPSIAAATVAASGTYTVTVSDAIGCSATATVNVTVNALPPAVAGNNGPVCSGTDIGLTSGGGLQYSWIGPGGYADPVSQNPIIVAATPANSGVYTVTVTDGNLCSATATTTLVINALPVVNANTNTPICNGNNINLTSNGAVNYDWVGPNAFVSAIQNPVIAGASAINNGTYTVTGTDANGCTASATVNVTTFPNPTALFVGNPLLGCAPLCVDLTDQSAGNGGVINNWSWNVEGQNPSASQNVNYCFNNPGIYDASLTVTTADGCSSTLSFPNYIAVSPNPVASFIYTPQIIMELHPDVTFASNSIGATNWLWDFGDGSFSNVENPIHAYQDTGIFCITLLVSNNAGCTDTTIGCLYIQPEYSLYIPNTFTVNGDGLNEIWQLYGRGIKKLEVRIFDRWGEELYFFDDLAKGWPGTRQNGSVCKQDVYVFRVEVTDPSNTTHVILGNVNLIR